MPQEKPGKLNRQMLNTIQLLSTLENKQFEDLYSRVVSSHEFVEADPADVRSAAAPIHKFLIRPNTKKEGTRD